MKWRLKLKEYQYEIVYKAEATNTNADTLSRIGQVAITKSSISNKLYSYQQYLDKVKNSSVINKNVKEEEGDLFDALKKCSLANCVSQNLKISQGITLMFRQKFGIVKMIKSKNPKIHDVIYIRQDNRYMLYLITKIKF